VDLLRSTPAPGRDGYSSEPTRLIMGNSALPTRGSPLTDQPILLHNQLCFRFSLFYCNKLYVPIHSTVLSFGDNQFNVQRRRSTIVQQSFGRQPTRTDRYAYIYREQRNICRCYCPRTLLKLSTLLVTQQMRCSKYYS
jgi:hypothetical protein